MSRWKDFAGNHPRAAAFLVRVRAVLPPVNFITLHYAYFIVVCLVASLIFWGSSSADFQVSYVDSLFCVVSAMTEAGLNTVNLSQMTTWQQIILFLLIMFGGSIWVSIWTVLARKRAFENRFKAIVKAEELRRLRNGGSSLNIGRPLLHKLSVSFKKSHSTPAEGTGLPTTGSKLPPRPETQSGEATSKLAPPFPRLEPAVSPLSPPVEGSGPGLVPTSSGHVSFADGGRSANLGRTTSAGGGLDIRPTRRAGLAAGVFPEKDTHQWDAPSFLTSRAAGRNGQFHDLTTEEREELGGCEYRALKILSVVVPLYFVLWQVLGCLGLGAWISHNLPGPALQNGINPWWLGIFNGASAFNNSGMSLLDANMIPFEEAFYVLITMALMILAGNTMYPVFLRFIFWTGLKGLEYFTAEDDCADLKATLEFILKYPRRVYTNLFPSRQTWWLLFMVILLNSIDWVAFELLNFGNAVIEAIPLGARVLDGLFQAVAVRSGGFYVVPISSLYIGLQVLYVIMMYISVYPVVITMRNSNVYEERSLGIYADDTTSYAQQADLEHAADLYEQRSVGAGSDAATAVPSPTTRKRRFSSGTGGGGGGGGGELRQALRRTFAPWHGVGVAPPRQAGDGSESHIGFISHQIHGQLAHDIWWLVLAVLVITTIETSHFLADPVHYSVFNVVFEVVSAYGCVGISVGVPSDSFSFAGGWHAASKVVLCLVMLRGRHRGLPVALDRAVRLPGEELHREEEEDHRIRRSMTSRRVSVDTTA
ncbi:uncharacterized protein E0L32_010841 [Thyridium curvatum]|uniref:Potassium transport protein n=1 Tax=Thyridium curvatum TaxID=1093900 RepID=A0A507AJZ8_9PEZI|nr:uncharacterized protein E0L32_010841 [Thyridium curvatum]TPX07247.1 hypothetical protein E0L32_010841 [Thyridium curvatum]